MFFTFANRVRDFPSFREKIQHVRRLSPNSINYVTIPSSAAAVCFELTCAQRSPRCCPIRVIVREVTSRARWQAQRYIAHPPFRAAVIHYGALGFTLAHSPQGGSTSVPRFTDDSVHAFATRRRDDVTQRDRTNGPRKSADATCPSRPHFDFT